jgi:CDP-diacylglycerol--glycerol-3-phosphate 3-phosphatidyltransferase
MSAVLDVACSLAQVGLFATMGAAYAVRAWRIGRARQRRADGVEAAMLGRPVMEAAYWFFMPVVRALIAIGATPNAVTTASLLAALAAGFSFGTGHLGVGAALFMVAGMCDLLDGVVARQLGTGSDAGEVFDATVDRYGEFFVVAGIAFHFRTMWPLELLAQGAILGSFMVSYATAKAEALRLAPPKGIMRRAERAVYLIAGAGLVPLVALVLPPTWAANPVLHDLPLLVALALVAVLANVSAVRRLYRTAMLARDRAVQAAAAKTEATLTRSAG